MTTMMRGDGFLGDYGAFSYRNMMLVMVLIGLVGSVLTGLALTPWSPWG